MCAAHGRTRSLGATDCRFAALALASARGSTSDSPESAPGNYATGIWTASTSSVSSKLAGQIASEQALRYAGYVYDSESGLYYCSKRYVDPATRQWTTADSAKADGDERARSSWRWPRRLPVAT